MKQFAKMIALLLIAAAPLQLGIASPSHARTAAQQDPTSELLAAAIEAISRQRPAEAIRLLDRAIAAQETADAGETRKIYSAHSTVVAVAYAGMAAKENKAAVILGPEWASAIFLKGFALIDLDRSDEARPLLERAVEMAPLNSQYVAELAEWHKAHREWDEAYDLFRRAEEAAAFSQDRERSGHKGRALRGQGFVLIEKGRLDEADALFRKCLEIDPDDERAKNELRYIDEQRTKPLLPVA